jgi:hypothetical protein
LVPAEVGIRDSAETEVRRPAAKPGGKAWTLRKLEEPPAEEEGGKAAEEGEEFVDEKEDRVPSSSWRDIRGPEESTPKGPEVKRELAAGVFERADPRRAWFNGAAAREEDDDLEGSLLLPKGEANEDEPLEVVGTEMEGIGSDEREVGEDGSVGRELDEDLDAIR